VIGDALQDIAKIEFGVEVVELGRTSKCTDTILLQRMNAPDGECLSCSRILPTYSKIKPAARDKVPQNASLIDAKYEPTPAGRNMLFPLSMVRNPTVPCCRRSAPAARQVQPRRFHRQKLGKTCLPLALQCWREQQQPPEGGKMLK
jgi:hypothetical protein